jgi:hypothetical protein
MDPMGRRTYRFGWLYETAENDSDIEIATCAALG